MKTIPFTLLFILIGVSIGGAENHLRTSIPESYQEMNAGSELWFHTSIDEELLVNTPTIVTHSVSCSGESLVSISEQIISKTTTDLFSSIEIPTEAEGDCVLSTRIWGVEQAQTESTFTILSNEEKIVIDEELSLSIAWHELIKKERLLLGITLESMNADKALDAFLEIQIKDPQGRTLTQKRVTTQVRGIEEIQEDVELPEKLGSGMYLITAQASYSQGRVSQAQSSFQVLGSEEKKLIYTIWGLGILIIITIIIAAILLRKRVAKKTSNTADNQASQEKNF